VETETTLVGTESGVELNAETTVDLDLFGCQRRIFFFPPIEASKLT
jgi:hypothetical protein